ncbi:HRDC domain-containing protein [Candidatus Electrothrix sp.]|uniref:HRDC domain-containing protein n=1 Tax=Candidatus Electrothrix sp. TaxID=2170559 RepID=UPI004056F720
MTFVNHELELANDFVRYTDCHIFLTGKAGTGKTTFLHNLERDSAKQMIITAPTGVAAINAGGVTLHSFFQLPFGPFLPGTEAYERMQQHRFRFSREKKKIIKGLDLLVIDEISMVRADLLDAVDEALRYHRHSPLPFGGVQVLMIGDLHQLAPVAKRDEWQLLKKEYTSLYFFSSKALSQTELITIELQHIYRQSDADFIRLLNRVRNNQLDQPTVTALNQRYLSGVKPGQDEGYITLTTHNRSADTINREQLSKLDTKEFCFEAEVSGDFPEHTYPAPEDLCLKKGAQVMFVRNDSGPEKRYYNGKIGKVHEITETAIIVRCPDSRQEIAVEPVVWENIKYTLNQEEGEIEEEVIGTFEQYPLKTAWAITIHKSQGLTFEKAIIDAQAAFAHGQVYVALSRCKTFEGMVLSSPIGRSGVATDGAVLHFDKHVQKNPPSQERLHRAKIGFQQKLLTECFDFQQLRNRLGYLVHLLRGNERLIQVMGTEIAELEEIEEQAGQDIFLVSENFRNQLYGLFSKGEMPASDSHLQERARKASEWFQNKFELIFNDAFTRLSFDTDNKELAKKVDKVLKNLKLDLAVKLAGIASCEQSFVPSDYLRAIAVAEMNFSSAKAKKSQGTYKVPTEIKHPVLFRALIKWRSRKARELDLAHSQIVHQRVLSQIAALLPANRDELRKIHGVGKMTMQKYGEDLLRMVADYQMKEEFSS